MNSEILKEDLKQLIQSANRLSEEPEQALEVPLEDLSMWHEQTEEMLISCDQAKVLTQQLLSLSRDRRAEKKVFAIQSACEEMSKLFRRVIREEVSLKLSMPQEMYYVEGNENAFKQALMNLVVNGRDALKGMGQLTINVETHEQGEKEYIASGPLHKGSYILIKVEDNGEGIPKEHLGKLFEPFFLVLKVTREQV